jgi:hypothetical protein
MDPLTNPILAVASRVAGKKERAFDIALPALIQGHDALESAFSERTEITSLSAQEAVFWLSAKVLIGSKLALYLQVPRTFLLERPLEVKLAGTVRYVRSDLSVSEKDHLVSVRLDRMFQIEASEGSSLQT